MPRLDLDLQKSSSGYINARGLKAACLCTRACGDFASAIGWIVGRMVVEKCAIMWI